MPTESANRPPSQTRSTAPLTPPGAPFPFRSCEAGIRCEPKPGGGNNPPLFKNRRRRTRMTRQGRVRAAGLVALGSLLAAAAPFPYSDLPPDLPERRPGLWEIRTEGSLSSGAVKTYEERSRICVDAAVDRALYQDNLDAKHMTVAMMGGSCEAPAYALDGNALSMTMQCTSRGVDGGPRAETTFASTTDIPARTG